MLVSLKLVLRVRTMNYKLSSNTFTKPVVQLLVFRNDVMNIKQSRMFACLLFKLFKCIVIF